MIEGIGVGVGVCVGDGDGDWDRTTPGMALRSGQRLRKFDGSRMSG